MAIDIKHDTDQEIFCKRLFPGGNPAKRAAQPIELFKLFGYDPVYGGSSDRETARKKTYSVRSALNIKIKNMSDGKIKHFFTTNKTFWINAKYR